MDRLLEIALGNAGSAVLMAVAAAVVTRFVRRPAVAHAIWVLVLLRLIAPPLIEFGLLPPPIQAVPNASMVSYSHASDSLLAEVPPTSGSVRVGARDVGVVLWVGGAIFALGLAVLRLVRLRKLVAAAPAADEDLVNRVSSIARSMGVTRAPVIRVIEGGAPPMLWGLIGAPTLLLPAPLLAELEVDEQNALIAHELAHLGRRDHWVRHLELISALAFWWHPVMWWARRRLRVAEELCCDLEVTRRLPGLARAYAGCLVKTARYLSLRPPVVAAGSAMASLHDLTGRITMIMTTQNHRQIPTALRVVFMLLAVALLALSPTLAARDGGAVDATFSGEPITLELQDADLRDLLSAFSMITDLTFVLHPSAEEAGLLKQPISTSFTDTPWDEALDTILAIRGLDWTREGSIVWIHPRWQAPAADEAGAGDRDFTGDPITLSFEGADVRDVLETFEKLTGMEIWVSAGVDATVTADLDDIPWDQALDLIIQVAGLQYRRDGASIYVERRSAATGEVLTPGKPVVPSQNRAAGDRPLRFIVGGDVSEPRKIGGPPPVYPEAARTAGEVGVVVLETVIEADGSVGAIEVLRGLPHGLTEAAVEAVRQWRYEPAVHQGEPVAVSYILTVRFSLAAQE